MPRYYCDYCDTYLTHDSASVRKQHNAGYKHKVEYICICVCILRFGAIFELDHHQRSISFVVQANVRAYYAQFFDQDGQRALEEKMKMQGPGGPMMNPMGMPMRPPMGGMPPFMGDPMGFGRGMPPGLQVFRLFSY